ncbi:lipase family protein [Lysobacter antibioticus]|uniref:Lipase family protein n=2 Tax=Lysobacter antibioticus TaxID=84531 RepID=A0A0S2FHV5_LYSAN|nr:lipase family protein [Lysobacter antibioticus]
MSLTMSSQEYANLAANAYPPSGARNGVETEVEFNGVEYNVLKRVDLPSGYQGTIYQRKDSGDIIVAHRGTEFGDEPIKDGLLADGGMVVKRINRQTQDAIDLTKQAIEIAQEIGPRTNPPEVSVTGHSLGGCLAQITAARFNLNGETFNPYGAASLGYRIPEGGNQVVNHVMAGDLVSAAGKHFGKVRMYAEPAELNVLKAAGYEDNGSQFDIRDPVKAAVAGSDSHRMHHFLDVDGEGRSDRSALGNPQSRELAEKHRPVIEKYRADIENLREGISIGAAIYRGSKGIAEEIGRHLPQKQPESPFRDAHGSLPASEQRAFDPRSPDHPHHSMHKALHSGIERALAEQGLPINETAERTTAALLVSSRQAGLERVNHVVAGRSTPAGTDIFAVQGELHDPAHKRAHVNSEVAAQIPVEASFQQLAAAEQKPTIAQDQQAQEQTRTHAARTA